GQGRPLCYELAMLEARSPEEVLARVRALAERFQAQTTDSSVRREVAEELKELRRLWKRNSGLFLTDTLDMLKELAQALEAPAAGGAGGTARATPEAVLHEVFGFKAFRPGQEAIIKSVLAGRDCVGIMPTGAGKSLTFQVPARVLGGTTLVVSPLIALMKDQVDALTEYGLRATFLNSSLAPEVRKSRLDRLARGEFELLYASPEGLEASVGWALRNLDLKLIAVDEAHCISHWGHDFRPAYRKLSGLKRRFPGVPVLALTATATRQVTRDIVEQLAMQKPQVYLGSFLRKNLRLSAYKKGAGLKPAVRKAILSLVQARRGQSGIIYCLSRKRAESLASYLVENGCRAGAYHAGMESDARAKVQQAFRADQIDVVVATIAFGMGIDKSNVRYVIHRDMPRSIEGYYQEIGRAGRDGVASDCVLFYSWSEVIAYDGFAAESDDEAQQARTRALVREMFEYCEAKGCRHQTLVRHFEEQAEPCGEACDQCLGTDLLATLPKGGRVRSSAPGATNVATAPGVGAGLEIFEQLKQLRRALADERGVPAYVIFSDATLLEMAAHRPTTPGQLLAITGVGPTKLERYGAAFLEVLQRGQ
ncbi:MAG TPA: ATP-dependent DNA helicase RecQ, partial [Polyangiaceae bacterium]|nr:ATP-dependent DNA helicase RecQ [Polyangiaceae bacterium]